jgi:hypothetical protein
MAQPAQKGNFERIRELREGDCHSTFVFPSRKQQAGGIRQTNMEAAMPAYEICYLDTEGALTYKFAADCVDDGRAKVLAHAMKLPSAKRLEVWSGETLIYARPSDTHPVHEQMLRAG